MKLNRNAQNGKPNFRTVGKREQKHNEDVGAEDAESAAARGGGKQKFVPF